MKKDIEEVDLNQISLTGTRAIIILGLLVNGSKTFDQLKKLLMEANVMESENSDDILRIDLNTLRTMGFDITKANFKNNFKYSLNSNPFGIKISYDDVELLRKIYKKAKHRSKINSLIQYDALFKKLAKSVEDKEISETLLGISVLKNYDINFIRVLQSDCEAHNVIKLVYYNVSTKVDEEKTIVALDMYYQNEKIYINCFDMNKKEQITLNIKRIKRLLSRTINENDDIKTKKTKIRFFIKRFGVNGLEENEKIIEKTPEGFLIEGEYYSDFWAIQRVLSFGSDCTVISPEDFKNKVIQKLKDIRKVYDDKK